MKLLSIIKKNYKLLIRSKASAFIVLIGPLLIILLVGLAFSGKTSYELSVGYHAPTQNNLTQSFITGLEQGEYYVQEFKDEQSCVKKIEQGVIHTCIIFPENFQISNEQSNELRFLVDYSRMNLVYKIIDSVSDILEIESKELSYSMTRILLSKINTTIRGLSANIVAVEELNPKINLLMLDLQKAKTNTETMKLDMRDISLSNINSEVFSLNETIELIKEKGVEFINKTREYLEIITDNYDYWDDNETDEILEDLDELINETLNLHNSTPAGIQNILNSIESTSSSLSKLESDLNVSKQLNEDTKAKLESAKSNLASMQITLLDLKNALEKTKQDLEGISITRAETIVSPVNTKIEPIMSETSKQTFMFPFLLVLVIMFVALLLSSTIIIFEKNSKAFFRNFITPTKQEFFVLTTFLTAFIVIVLQTIIILGLANFFLQIPLFKNALLTLLIVFVTTMFFIAIGMAIGYLFSTQEGAVMASIVIGAVFMFLSNLVVPLETLAPALSGLIKYNPYVLASELLRKSLLFKLGLSEAVVNILILLGASVIILLVILLSHIIFYKKRINQPSDALETRLLQGKRPAPITELIKKDIRKISDKKELFKAIAHMTKAEFEEQVTTKENKIADLVEKKLGEKRLAHKLRKTTSKKEILKILLEDIRKEKS